MPTLTYNYVYFAYGKHQRQPRAASGPGGFALIQSIAGGTLASGDTFAVGVQPATQSVGGATYAFGFVNVSDGTTGGQTSFDSNTPAPLVTVGSAPIVVLVVYIPVGGGGGGNDSGATIDSFNETVGSLFNDTFVSVAPDQGGALTTSGNVWGYVDTWASAEKITAISPTSPSGAVFDKWAILGSKTGVPGANLAVAKGVSVSALAFYKNPPAAQPNPAKALCAETAASLVAMASQGPNGPMFTVTEWAGVRATLQKCVMQGFLTQAYVNTLEAQYLAYVASHGTSGGGLGKPPLP
jgi:hypothetical protein